MKNEILRLRTEGLSYKEISEKLKINKSLISYHVKKNKMNEPLGGKGVKLSNEMIDSIKQLNDGKRTKAEISRLLNISYGTVKRYTTKKEKVRLSDEEKRKKEYNKNKNWRTNLKIKCVKFLGGKCSICGYNKCLGALDLHHKNEKNKEFTISGGNLKSFEKLIPELIKCDVLCSNCHRELHNPHLIDIL